MGRMLPPAYFGLALLCEIGAVLLAPRSDVADGVRVAGVVAIGLGVALNLAADRAFKARSTTVKPFETPSSLVTSGVFRMTRNPMYLGMTLILFGAALAAGSLWALAAPVAFAALVQRRFIGAEEAQLSQCFGADWEVYRRTTRRWL